MTPEPPFTNYDDFLKRTVHELKQGVEYKVAVTITPHKGSPYATINSSQNYSILEGTNILAQFETYGPGYDYDELPNEARQDEENDKERMLNNINQIVAQETKYLGIKKDGNYSFKLKQYGEDVPKGKQIGLNLF